MSHSENSEIEEIPILLPVALVTDGTVKEENQSYMNQDDDSSKEAFVI